MRVDEAERKAAEDVKEVMEHPNPEIYFYDCFGWEVVHTEVDVAIYFDRNQQDGVSGKDFEEALQECFVAAYLRGKLE